MNKSIESVEIKVCDFRYISDMVNCKKQLIISLMDIFISQVSNELKSINKAVSDSDFPVIMKFAHTMMSSVSIMGIYSLTPILKEMEKLGKLEIDIERIKALNQKLNLICKQAFKEVEAEKFNYR